MTRLSRLHFVRTLARLALCTGAALAMGTGASLFGAMPMLMTEDLSAPAASPSQESTATDAQTPALSAPAAAPAGTSSLSGLRQEPRIEVARMVAPEGGRAARVFVLPIQGEINPSVEYIVRRGIRDALDFRADLLLLHMDTPGGRLDVTLEVMKMLDRFQGRTAVLVDAEAGSAGALISAAVQNLYFTKDAVIGAAEPVQSGGKDVDASMKRKILSFMEAKIRTLDGVESHRYRGEIVRAMMNPEAELAIDGVRIKGKDALLTLTGKEACALYGAPPQPLLGSGVVDGSEEAAVRDLLDRLYGPGAWERKDFDMSWSVHLARLLTSSAVVSLLVGLGLLSIYIEVKTPGFGFWGILGGLCLLTVFFGHYVAGLSGHEPMLFFLLGLVLIGVEVFVIPGTGIFGVLGLLCILGSLLWAMADIWPALPGQGWSIDSSQFLRPLGQLGAGLLIAGAGGALALRFLPRTRLYGQMVLHSTLPVDAAGRTRADAPADSSSPTPAAVPALPAPGTCGVATTQLRPFGTVEIAGHSYEARLEFGDLPSGTAVKVVGSRHGVLIVQSGS